ncbi:MAG: hypothetical protein IJJ73_08950 [Bacteroidaceae bacterium]|nr:hypothetical protein [Bacteroidaceae bacterium]
MTQEEYLASVEESKKEAHDETMWGKPARDIITGIGNNSGIRPVRAIWELVQNARDVVGDGKRANIVFTRKQDSLDFKHNGIPFTHKTIEALIMQTSSKVSSNKVQVGQYGTGFLTTHMFGLTFKLTAPLLTSEEFPRYYKIPEFKIDRSSTEKEVMRDKLKDQWRETQDWGRNYSQTTDTPFEYTLFSYQHEGNQARLNAESAFADAPDMVPFVLSINPNVESICFEDQIKSESTTYLRENQEMDFVEDITNGKIYKTKVHRAKINTNNHQKEEKDYFIYCIVSNDKSKEAPYVNKVTVILPITEDADGSLRVLLFDKSLPQIYIYLPLLGTEEWGFNFLLHSPLFTCDKDSRDSLRLVGNGQNNDDQAEANRSIIELANKLICQFIDKKISTLRDAKYLCRISFKTQQPETKLSEYYKSLQTFWRNKYENLCIVEGGLSTKYLVSATKVLDESLAKACEEDSTLLDAIYGLFNKNRFWTVPKKEDMVYWSNTINRWYRDETTNNHQLTIEDLAQSIPSLTIINDDLVWLHKLCEYISKNQDTLLDTYTLIPNESLSLHKKAPLLRTVAFAKVVKDALALMDPVAVDNFVHPAFVDIANDTVFDYTKAKESITNYINNHNTEQNGVRNNIMMDKNHDLQNPHLQKRFNLNAYEDKKLSDDIVQVILNLYQALLPEDSEAIPAKLLPVIASYYNITLQENVARLEKSYELDVRQFYTTLIYDSLFNFTLRDDKQSKATWVKSMVKLVYSYSDIKSYLTYYQVYPDQQGNYKYAEWLKKKAGTLPDRALEIYDTIIRNVSSADNSRSIKKELVSSEFAQWFVGTNILDGLSQCKEIEDEVQKKGYSITYYEHQKLIVEIIEHLTRNDVENEQWHALFRDIEKNKGQIMFSVIQSQTKKDSIFALMKVDDENKLKAIAELVNNPDFESILLISKNVIDQRAREANDFQFKKDLGAYVEDILLKELNTELGNNIIEVPEPVRNEQGGQDLILRINGEDFYYFEVKSRWTSDRSVLMSTEQHRQSYENKEHYALLAADMVGYDMDKVRRHEFPKFEEVKERIVVLDEIGKLNERLKDATLNDDNQVHVAGGYHVLISQGVIRNNAKSFDVFIESLKLAIRKKIHGISDSKI